MDLESKVNADLEKIRPANGKVLVNNGVTGGYSQFTVKAYADSDACIKLEDKENPDKYVMFYVQSGQSSTISVRDSKYIAKYTTGKCWFGEEAMFGKDASFTQANGTIDLTVTYIGFMCITRKLQLRFTPFWEEC